MQIFLFYLFGLTLGNVLYLMSFNLGVLSSVAIIFYRGLALAFLSAILHWFSLLFFKRFFNSWSRAKLCLKDLIVITALTLSFNLTFLIVVPVTLDRSVSIFLLGYMGQNASKIYTKTELKQALKTIYIDDFDAVARRMDEQIFSNNIEAINGGYRLTSQGISFLELNKMLRLILQTKLKFVLSTPVKRDETQNQLIAN